MPQGSDEERLHLVPGWTSGFVPGRLTGCVGSTICKVSRDISSIDSLPARYQRARP